MAAEPESPAEEVDKIAAIIAKEHALLSCFISTC